MEEIREFDIIEHAAKTQQFQKERATSHTEDVVDLAEEEWEGTSEDTKGEKTEGNKRLTAEKILKNERKILKDIEEVFGDVAEECQPPELTETRIMVEALELLIRKMEVAVGQKGPSQSELPVMKNNDQRKEWLRAYREWGLWYEDKNIGAKYYKYDFENGARLIVEEYLTDTSCGREYALPYFHLVGGPEPPKVKYGYGKWTRNRRYCKHPDSETELVEFLKFTQRRG